MIPWFQSTHPRRVRLCAHTATRTATRFNPRTHVGCDTKNVYVLFALYSFNPRTHVGCDTTACAGASALDSFNPRTHVGCDQKRRLSCWACLCFNPRTHVGCDASIGQPQEIPSKFQSTHPRRVRLFANHTANGFIEFQSTHPRRVRQSLDDLRTTLEEFQSTHPRRVRLYYIKFNDVTLQGFNPRTHVGCDVA